jgi:hypothetical protein
MVDIHQNGVEKKKITGQSLVPVERRSFGEAAFGERKVQWESEQLWLKEWKGKVDAVGVDLLATNLGSGSLINHFLRPKLCLYYVNLIV